MTTLVQPELINASVLTGFRNKIINGNFDVWQRGSSQTSSGYASDDRWRNDNSGSTKTASQQSFTLGQTDVPGNPTYYSRTVVTSSAGASNYVRKEQKIEGVSTFSGKTVTLTFYAKASSTLNIATEFRQNFGSSGSPSSAVNEIGVTTHALTTSWQKFSIIVSIPSISGKTLGTDENDYLRLFFWFDAGSDFNNNTNSLGNQSGTFDIARVSLVEGDATNEDDPFSPRNYTDELFLCYRYYESINSNLLSESFNAGGTDTYYFGQRFLAIKRAAPTVVLTQNSAINIGSVTHSNVGKTGFRLLLNSSSTGRASYNGYYSADAEL